MQAKIILLPGSGIGDRLCGIAEEVLTDVSVAFGHTFSILRDKLGDAAVRSYGQPLADHTVRVCADANAVFIGDGRNQGEQLLLQALGIPLKMRAFNVGETGQSCFRLLSCLHYDMTAFQAMFRIAYAAAAGEDAPLHYVLPETEPIIGAFLSAEQTVHQDFSSVHSEALTPSDAIERLILAPSELGLLVAPAYAGQAFLSLATCLHGAPMLLFDACAGSGASVFEPFIPDGVKVNDELNPLGAVSAVAEMLRTSLQLTKEADCVASAVKNILDAGWRTPDMTSMGDGIGTYKMMQLISEQINLAGELMQRGGHA
ncbi:MAG: hypothetical protein IJ240_00640 [Clostridia bacterium]|nr:hypothetical protein [Clostridia bacterium]